MPRQAGRTVGVGTDLLDIVVIAVTRRVAQQHEVAIADDRGEDIVEIMRHPTCQLADRLHLGRLRHLPLEAGFLGRIDKAEQHRRLAQSAHPCKAE